MFRLLFGHHQAEAAEPTVFMVWLRACRSEASSLELSRFQWKLTDCSQSQVPILIIFRTIKYRDMQPL
jgi:hypothetical protein